MKLELRESEVKYARKIMKGYSQQVRWRRIFFWFLITMSVLLLACTVLKIYLADQINDRSNNLSNAELFDTPKNIEEMRKYIDAKSALDRQVNKLYVDTYFHMIESILIFSLAFLIRRKTKLEPVDIKIYRELLKELDEKTDNERTSV